MQIALEKERCIPLVFISVARVSGRRSLLSPSSDSDGLSSMKSQFFDWTTIQNADLNKLLGWVWDQ
jgi:hypothetical protein